MWASLSTEGPALTTGRCRPGLGVPSLGQVELGFFTCTWDRSNPYPTRMLEGFKLGLKKAFVTGKRWIPHFKITLPSWASHLPALASVSLCTVEIIAVEPCIIFVKMDNSLELPIRRFIHLFLREKYLCSFHVPGLHALVPACASGLPTVISAETFHSTSYLLGTYHTLFSYLFICLRFSLSPSMRAGAFVLSFFL